MDDWHYILKFLRPHRWRIAGAMTAWLGIMLVDLGSPLALAILIDVIVAQSRYEWLVPVMAVFVLLPFAAAGLNITSTWLMTRVSQRLIFDLRRTLYARVHLLSHRYLTATTTGKLMQRLRGDVEQLQMLLSNRTPALVVQTVTGLLMVTIMFSLSARLTILALASIGV